MSPRHPHSTELYRKNVGLALAAIHNCKGEHLRTDHVHETINGQTVWETSVEIFSVEGHPKAKQLFAWGYEDVDGKTTYIATLAVPPIISPREAVQAAIANGKQK